MAMMIGTWRECGAGKHKITAARAIVETRYAKEK